MANFIIHVARAQILGGLRSISAGMTSLKAGQSD
jgi:hypothetical protein